MAVVVAQDLFRKPLHGYCLWFDFSHPSLGTAERCTFYIVLITDIMSTVVLLANTIFGRLFSCLSATFVGIEHKLCKIHELDGQEPDGAEPYLKAMLNAAM